VAEEETSEDQTASEEDTEEAEVAWTTSSECHQCQTLTILETTVECREVASEDVVVSEVIEATTTEAEETTEVAAISKAKEEETSWAEEVPNSEEEETSTAIVVGI